MSDQPEGPTAGAGAIVWRGDEVLLIKRGKAPRLGEWSIPGGRIEPGETAEAAAIREVLEETGCTIVILDLCDVVDAIGEGRHMVLFDFTARWVSGEPVAGDDAAEARFIAFHEISALGMWSETLQVIALSRTQILG
jgi:8-oxo-dGTP diphosphatase